MISFFKFEARVSGHVTERIIFVSVCSIRHMGKITSLTFSMLASSIPLKLFVLLMFRSKYFFNSQSFSEELEESLVHKLLIVMAVIYFLE